MLLNLTGNHSTSFWRRSESRKFLTPVDVLQEYISKYHTKPEYVILGLASYMGKFDIETIHPIIEFTQKNHKYNLKDIPIVKFQWLGVQFLKKIVSSIHRNVRLSYGQLKSPKVTPDKTSYDSLNFCISSYASSYYIRKIAEICRDNKIELILLEMPGFKETQNNSDLGPYQINLCNGLTIPLFNLNSIEFCKIFDSEKDWIANSHLNEYGANKLTRHLLDSLNKKGYSLY